MRDNHLLALPEPGSDDVRPIGMGRVYRKLASKVGFQAAADEFNEKHFKDVQRALVKLGTEEIVHGFRQHLQQYPQHDTFAMDDDELVSLQAFPYKLHAS